MLYLVGVGLVPEHITEAGIEAIRRAEKVLLDSYTVPVDEENVKKLEEIVGKELERASRTDLEEGATELVEEAREKDVAVVTWGDPLAATTHVVLTIIADERGVPWKYVPGISILTYIPSRLGLEHYKFGWTVTIPHGWEYAPSFYERIRQNCKRRMHTLVLLDVGEEPMRIEEGIKALLHWAEREGRGWDKIVGIARAAHEDEKIVYGDPEELLEEEWPDPPHSIVIPGKLHPVEEDALRRFSRGER
ncbi:MAG: diphthine synthase [Candidatus Diapherotrites archaeon]|nr:diphthine synthase [Candidatus Diapherotrites archaeon]MDN5366759.1 diphthine synthase [Candidatus Diapherotrites archaeon]